MVGLGQMPGQAGTDESLSAMAVIVGSLIEERDRITRSIRIGPIGETTAVSFPFPVAQLWRAIPTQWRRCGAGFVRFAR